MTLIEVTIKTEEYGLSDYVKETNKGHNRLLNSVEKEDTKKKNKEDNIKKLKTKDWTEKPLHGQYPRLAADASLTLFIVRNVQYYMHIKQQVKSEIHAIYA